MTSVMNIEHINTIFRSSVASLSSQVPIELLVCHSGRKINSCSAPETFVSEQLPGTVEFCPSSSLFALGLPIKIPDMTAKVTNCNDKLDKTKNLFDKKVFLNICSNLLFFKTVNGVIQEVRTERRRIFLLLSSSVFKTFPIDLSTFWLSSLAENSLLVFNLL